MSVKKYMVHTKKSILVMVLLFSFPIVAFANAVWPALYAESGMFAVPVIAIGLLIEYFFFKHLFTISNRKALYITLVANAVSTVAGAPLRTISGLVWEVSVKELLYIVDIYTFNPIKWGSVVVLGSIINALLELLVIRIFWKYKFSRRNVLLTWLINGITVALALIWIHFFGVV